MAGYNRGEFFKYSKGELLDYIEQQNEQLTRFESRFRDVVKAYKGLLKEKEALEASLQAISGGAGVGGGGVPVTGDTGEGVRNREQSPAHLEARCEGVESEGEGGVGTEAGRRTDESETDEGNEGQTTAVMTETSGREKAAVSGSLEQTLRQQINTLTVALATLMEEKSKMETSFQADKRSLLAQQDSLNKQLQSERERASEETMRLEQKLEALQHALRAERQSRDDEQADQAAMLRELQELIAREREQKEAYVKQLHEAELELQKLRTQMAEDRTREYEDKLHNLSGELEDVRSRLQVAEKQAGKPQPLLLQLQSEIAKMKEEHVKSMEAEQQRANEAEERLRTQAQREEQRVASLESKLSDLSDTVGNYDRQRELDLLSIHKLKERIAQLDSENTALTRTQVERLSNESAEQLSALQEKMVRLKTFVKIATLKINERASLPADLEELSAGDYAELLASEPSRRDYQLELHQLKDEFEKYKMRAQSVLRSRGSKEPDPTHREIKELQTRNNELQARVDALQAQCEEAEERQLLLTQKLRTEMRELHERHRQEIGALEGQHRQRLQDLQQQMQTTRERTMKLMAEKDLEIQKLKLELHALLFPRSSLRREGSFGRVSISSQPETPTENTDSNHHTDGRPALNLSIRSTDSTNAVQELLEQPSPASAGETKLFHFVQEQNRRESELVAARRKRLELEDSIRDLHEREHRHMEQNTLLKEEIRKLERGRSRETESLEYLKNVIIHYMCADLTGREQMVIPIATILHFSPEEVLQIKRKLASKRWLPRTPS